MRNRYQIFIQITESTSEPCKLNQSLISRSQALKNIISFRFKNQNQSQTLINIISSFKEMIFIKFDPVIKILAPIHIFNSINI